MSTWTEYFKFLSTVPKDFSIEHLNYYTKEFKTSIAIGGFGEVFKGWVVKTNGDIVQKLAVKKSHDSSTGTMKQWQVNNLLN